MLISLLLWLAAAVAGGPQGPLPTEGWVASVYDGDTLTLESGDKIRLRWVNCPELRPAEAYGVEAKQLAVDLVLRQRVKLVVAPDGRDGYGRVVAGVRTDTRDLSLALVEAGLAHVFIIPPDDADPAPLLAAQAVARAARRGIWSDEHYQGALHITSFHHNAPGDDATNVNGEYLRVVNLTDGEVDMSDYRLQNGAGRVLEMTSVYVPAGHTVVVRSGKGVEQTNPLRQLTVHLGSDTPLFDDERDEVKLLDRSGRVVDWRTAGR